MNRRTNVDCAPAERAAPHAGTEVSRREPLSVWGWLRCWLSSRAFHARHGGLSTQPIDTWQPRATERRDEFAPRIVVRRLSNPAAAGRRRYARLVRRQRVERKLRDVSGQLTKLREELAVADDQLLHFADEADETRLRSLVSETPLADKENRAAQKHADVLRRQRTRVAEQIARLEAEQDALLDRLTTDG